MNGLGLTVLKVSQLNRYVRSQLESDERLSEVYLKGEIANLAIYPSGHIYFSLRDEVSSVRAVMFASSAAYLRAYPENGAQVLVRGSVSLYERDGTFQIKVTELVMQGDGERAMRLELLRKKLAEEGLFSSERKKPLPQNVGTIGVVTSERGAVIHDIISVLERKAPYVNVILAPVSVQGEGVSRKIADAIEALNLDGRSDVIIIARGGGSAEDLSAFNEECVVRAAADSKIPVISAIGHETDVSLCDLAADMRAATPTAAAEMAVGSMPDMSSVIKTIKAKLDLAVNCNLESMQRELYIKKVEISAFKPENFLALYEERLYNITEKMHIASRNIISDREKKLGETAARLELISPLKVLSRGYSITTKNDTPLSSVNKLENGEMIETILPDGKIISVITEVRANDI